MALFLKLMGGKLNIFQNSGKFFGKLKENILKLNIIHNVEWTAALTSQSFYICECNTQQKLISLKKTQEISDQNAIILAKLYFSEIPFPYDGAKMAKKKPDW